MNLSRNWLSDFVNTEGIDNHAYCDRMTATGSKVEGFTVLGEDIENVIVAKITHMERHPDSDHPCKVCNPSRRKRNRKRPLPPRAR